MMQCKGSKREIDIDMGMMMVRKRLKSMKRIGFNGFISAGMSA